MLQLDSKSIWLFFLRFIISWFFSLLSFGIIVSFLLLVGSDTRPSVPGLIKWGIFIILAILVIAYVWARLTRRFYRYELREDGFRKEHGIIWKKYVTIPYDRIQNVDIYRGLIARLLGLSDLQVQTAGGITSGSYGAFSEGRLPGLSKEIAEQVRDELVRRARTSRGGQGL